MSYFFNNKSDSISILITLAGILGICLVGCVQLDNTQSEPIISSSDHIDNIKRPAQEATTMPGTEITLQDATSLVIDEKHHSADGQKMNRETRALWEQVGPRENRFPGRMLIP